jgi:hypothetical protein
MIKMYNPYNSLKIEKQKNFWSSLVTAIIILIFNYLNKFPVYGVQNVGNTPQYLVTAKRDILTLMMAYPEYITGVQKNLDGKIYVVMKSGSKLLYDDGRKKEYKEKLSDPDLQDMLEQLYPLSDIEELMEEYYDPGRIRVYTLLHDVYGITRGKIQSNLVNVSIGNQNCQFNKNNKAAESLQLIMTELMPLLKTKPGIRRFVFPTSGTFNYRVISGTGRLSPHSFGTAIDLKSDKRDYWKWTPREQGQERLYLYPREVVRIFEKYNFIWGGKWGHFDILHFEYRPEIIIKSKYFSTLPAEGKPWYDGVPVNEKEVMNFIKIIEQALDS